MSSITRLIHLKNNNGIPCWHYVRIPQTRMPLYMAFQQGDTITIDQFGEVLASGWGTTPPPHIQMQHGIDPYHPNQAFTHEGDKALYLGSNAA